MQNSTTNHESEISLKDVFFFLLKHWKVLVICLLIGGLLGAGVSLLKWLPAKDRTVSVSDFDETKLDMDRIKLYRDYCSLYERERDYRDNSLLMQLDSNAVYQGELEYLLTCTEDKMNEVGIVLMDMMQNEDRRNRLLAESGLSCSTKAFAELVVMDFEPETNGEEFITEAGITVKHDVKLTVSIRTPDENSCLKLMNAFQDEMEELGGEIEVQFPENYFSDVVKNRIVFGRDDDLNEKQATEIETLNTYLNQRNALQDKLTSAEKAYYKVAYEKDKSGGNAVRASFSKKFPVLGAAAGLLLPLLLLALYYLFCGRVRSEEDLSDELGLPVLGTVPGKEKKQFLLDKPIAKWESKYDLPYNDLDEVSSVVSAKEFGKGVILATTETEIEKANELAAKDNRLQVAASLLDENETINNLESGDAVILTVTRDETKTAIIRQNLKLAEKKGAQVLGAIYIK